MTKFHINKKGVPAPCKATKGKCPLGGDSGNENHFDNKEDAQKFADKQNEQNHGLLNSINLSRSAETVKGFDAELEKKLFSKRAVDRMFAAKKGYGAEILANDKRDIRMELAKRGYIPDILAKDEDSEIRFVVAGLGKYKLSDDSIELLANDEDWQVRRQVASIGKKLEKLSNDEKPEVRGQVALQEYNLEKLVNDESPWVREKVAIVGYGLDKLVNDENYRVRKEVAMHGYELNKLIKDEHPDVRKMVALQGYGLVELQYDKDKNVREAVDYSLNPELFNPPVREKSFSLYRHGGVSIKPVDYKEYAKEHNVGIPEAAKMRMKENLNIINKNYELEFEDDKPVFYKISDGKKIKLDGYDDGSIKSSYSINDATRMNRLVKQYYEALKIRL